MNETWPLEWDEEEKLADESSLRSSILIFLMIFFSFISRNFVLSESLVPFLHRPELSFSQLGFIAVVYDLLSLVTVGR